MKPVLIHTHFHRRKTGVTRSIENVLGYFDKHFDTFVYGTNIEGNLLTKRQCKKLLFSKRKVVVHCHRNNEILRMLVFKFLGAKFTLIATRHAATKPSWLTLFLLKKADKVVTLIPEMSASLEIPNTLIGHGVQTEFFKPQKDLYLPNISQKNIILNTGRIRKAKGQLDLLIAANVLKKHQDWALVLVGRVDKPAFLQELKSIAEKEGIVHQVYFLEETKDIISYYQAATIMVAPSYSEGFSLVTAEAMSCGCITIATENVGVHNNLIHHGKNGYLYEAGNVKKLQELLEQTMQDPKQEIVTAARDTILKDWSASQEADALTALYLSET